MSTEVLFDFKNDVEDCPDSCIIIVVKSKLEVYI
ncbi:hypothetical protein HNP81_004102 [Peribacillus huizhouensis]|uniref:Uncharacterized protein n=1 Tax=Peribacillus huizhouensis TaxID=1501239 RepID=A0ABR6CV29_9BACI|nr:hypothetical protein [Peribacillus huizhouensis]